MARVAADRRLTGLEHVERVLGRRPAHLPSAASFDPHRMTVRIAPIIVPETFADAALSAASEHRAIDAIGRALDAQGANRGPVRAARARLPALCFELSLCDRLHSYVRTLTDSRSSGSGAYRAFARASISRRLSRRSQDGPGPLGTSVSVGRVARVGDYVSHDERVRRDEADRSAAAAAAGAVHEAQLAETVAVLARLGDRHTDCYLEILRPARGWRRHVKGRTIVMRSGLKGGPAFFIAEVLTAHRIVGGIVRPPFKDVGARTFDAYVALDGRVWPFAGRGVTADTYQFLSSSVRRLAELSTDDLERIASAMRRHLQA